MELPVGELRRADSDDLAQPLGVRELRTDSSQLPSAGPSSCIYEKILYAFSKVIAMRTTVTSRGQTVVPAKIRKDHQIHPQTQLEWIDDGETIRVVPIPLDTIRAAKGISKGLRRRLIKEREQERQRG
jgi:bifunctional DNA-binding transcriptional regulator/antitoxin component of YhaV-PrlF toxin-antitoxin module